MVATFKNILTIIFCAPIMLPLLLIQSCGSIKSDQQLRSEVINPKAAKGEFFTRKYRNLFAENGYTSAEIDQKINTAFQQLFYGDATRQAIYFPAGENSNGHSAYIFDAYNGDIRSEGMSYGMMITVQLNRKAEFDAIWNYAVSHLYIDKPGDPANGYFSWSVKPDGIKKADGPAPDGEEYFVMALYFASGRWGNGHGIYDYKAWADKILTNIRHHSSSAAATQNGKQTVGGMVNEDKKMILFVPGGNGNSFSDPSYHLPAFYQLWSRWGPKADRKFWADAADTSRDYFGKATNPATGLSADYADFNGKPIVTSFNPNSQNFAYDSWRTAMNWSVDWAWWHKDNREITRSSTIQNFFALQGINNYGDVYTWEGNEISKDHSAGLVAANAVTSLAATTPETKKFVAALWNLQVPESLGERYYGGLLYLMSLLHCSGQFQIYEPL